MLGFNGEPLAGKFATLDSATAPPLAYFFTLPPFFITLPSVTPIAIFLWALIASDI